MTPQPGGNAEHVSGKLIGVERQWADGGIRAKQTWQHVTTQLDEAAHGADPVNVATALQMVLGMERVDYRLK